MNQICEFSVNKASAEQIASHLLCCDSDFLPLLSDRVVINDYAEKLEKYATRFEAWSGSLLIGLVAIYCNDEKKFLAHITNVSLLSTWRRCGIAQNLIGQCIQHAKIKNMRNINLSVGVSNYSAIDLYLKNGFSICSSDEFFAEMVVNIEDGVNL